MTKPHILLTKGVKKIDILNLRDGLTGAPIFKTDQYVLKKYTDEYYRLIYLKAPVRQTGYELPWDTAEKTADKEQVVEKRLDNIYRAKSRIFEIAMCNDFEYFGTFTLDKDKISRADLHGTYEKIAKWLSNRQRTKGVIKYVIIPELHSCGKNWHFHGLFYFENVGENLQEFEIKKEMPKRQKIKINQLKKENYLNFPAYFEKFGFCSFGKIKDKERASSYITKYITKALGNADEVGQNKKLYYCSSGLKRAKKISTGNITDLPMLIREKGKAFENEYCSIQILTKADIENYFSCEL